MKSKIFITGITGCVGHYVFDALVSNPDYELYLLIRNPQKMLRNLSAYKNVFVVSGDLRRIEEHTKLLKQMDYVVHIAANWGATEVNYHHTIKLFSLLDPVKCKKIIYFSTASILDSNNEPVDSAYQFGTWYIKAKYQCYQHLPQLRVYDRIITLFPTWVLGGDQSHPYSHALSGITGVKKRLWLLRFFTVNLKFHFIHAEDVALIVDFLLKSEAHEKKYVLGNALISAGQLIEEVCGYYHKKIYFRIRISPWLIRLLAWLLGRWLHPWDKYCLSKNKFEYKVVNAATFGLSSRYETIADILKTL